MQYIYDEQGVTFNYFLLTFLAIFLLPTTFLLPLKSRKNEEEGRKSNCYCEACNRKETRIASLKAPSSTSRINKTAVGVALGWILFAYLTYRVSTVQIDVEIWDPYQILGISEGTTIEDIKKVYKKLSLLWHPDKAPEDQKTEHEVKFIDITKAYKVLTDDDIRKNYEEWGHPDGKQAYSLGIALPTWLVESKNNIFVLGVYGIVFGILLPFFVGRWWYSSNGYTKDKIRTHTMALFFKELRDKSSTKHILELLSASMEFLELVEQRPSDALVLPPIVSSIKDELDRRFGERFDKSKKKANALLHAHLLRINVTEEVLLRDQIFIVEKAANLLNGILDVALAHQWLAPTIHCMELRQLLVQAVWPGENPLVQLPHINHDVLRAMKSKKRNIRSVAQLREMNEGDRKILLRTLTDSQYEDVKRIAESYPILEIVRAYFKVTGDEIVTPGSIVTFILKVRLIEFPLNKQENGLDHSISENDTEVEGKTNQLKSNKKANKNAATNGYYSSDSEMDNENSIFLKTKHEAQNSWIHAPYFPIHKRAFWYVFIADEKDDRIIVNPVKISGVNEGRTIRVQFQAPPNPGFYSYILQIKSDSYVGSDIKKDIKLEVQNFDALPPEDPINDDISEPDEDSIAGQMKLMREQGLAAAVAGGGEQKNGSDSSDSDDD
ncbi:hypothetical protein G9A89_003077 [Geosiphon pyriformis]|nr:hypothetical protein G9A89_003077 [Geosiphon pyriformis]